jgi:hypothetical protein
VEKASSDTWATSPETDSLASRKHDEANGLNAGKRGPALVVHPFWLFCSLFGFLVRKVAAFLHYLLAFAQCVHFLMEQVDLPKQENNLGMRGDQYRQLLTPPFPDGPQMVPGRPRAHGLLGPDNQISNNKEERHFQAQRNERGPNEDEFL